MLIRPAFVCLFASLLLPSCSGLRKKSDEEKTDANRRLSLKSHTEYRAQPDWKKRIFRDPVGIAKLDPGTSNIRISLAEQRGILFAGNFVAIDFPVSTGKAGHRTPTGKFRVMEKDIDHRSNLYGTRVSGGRVIDHDASTRNSSPEGRFVGAPMPYFMRLTGSGVGLHVGHVPDYPASHGCIRVPKKVMPEIFMNSKTGTPVVIQQASLVGANGPEPASGASGSTKKKSSATSAAPKKEVSTSSSEPSKPKRKVVRSKPTSSPSRSREKSESKSATEDAKPVMEEKVKEATEEATKPAGEEAKPTDPESTKPAATEEVKPAPAEAKPEEKPAPAAAPATDAPAPGA